MSHPVQTALMQREQYLATLVEIQQRLLSTTIAHPCYAEVLQLLGPVSGASRVYVFENHYSPDGQLLMSQRAEWCDIGVIAEIDNPLLQNLSYEDFFPRWVEVLQQGQIIAGLVSAFPEPERVILEPQGILSILILPLLLKGQFFGFIGFDNCVEARPWSAAEVHLLSAAAAAIILFQERQQSEVALRQSEATNRALLEAIPDLMVRIHRDGTYLDHKPAKNSDPLISNSELIGKSLFEVLPLEMAQQRLDMIHQTLETREPQVIEYPFTVQGETRQQEARIVPYAPDEALLLIRDITERKQAEAALQQAKNQFQAVLDAVPGYISWFSADLKYLGVNRYLTNLFDLEPESFVGQDIGFLQSSPKFIEFVRQFFASSEVESSKVLEVKSKGVAQSHLMVGQKYNENQAAVFVGIDITERKQAEAALRQSEARLQAVVKNTPTILFSLDSQGIFTLSEGKGLERLGLTSGQVVGQSAFDLYADNPMILTSLKQVLTGQEREWRSEVNNLFFETQGSPLYDTDGQVTGLIGISLDITERHQAEQALQAAYAELETRVEVRTAALSQINQQLMREVVERKRIEESLQTSEEHLKAILNNIPALAWLKDKEGRYIAVNQSFGKTVGCSPAAVIGKTDLEVWPQHIAAAYQADDLEVMASGQQKSVEELIIDAAGRTSWIQTFKAPLYDEHNQVAGTTGVAWDITTQKLAAESIYQREQQFRALLENTPDLIMRCDRHHYFVYVNPAVEKNLGMKTSTLLGKSFNQVWLSKSQGQTLEQAQEQALFSGLQQVVELDLPTLYGLRTYQAQVVPEFDTEGRVQSTLVVARDISKLKQAEAEMQEALDKERELNDLKSRFITTTSHEFRTPLATILFSAGLLQDYGPQWTEAKKLTHLGRIQTAVKRMTHLLEDVLLIGKAEASRLQCQPALLNLDEFCQELIEELQVSLNSQHQVSFHSSGLKADVPLDEKLLRPIVSNLLSNAIKYSSLEAVTQCEVVYAANHVKISIQDQGIGIPVADQPRIFESFHRATNVGTIQGTGLGLAIVKQCVDLHQGTLEISSQVEQGTLVTVTIPVTTAVEGLSL